MELKLTICSQNPIDGQKWSAQFKEFFLGIAQVQIFEGCEHIEQGQILFFDSRLEGLESRLGQADRRSQAIVLVMLDGNEVPELLRDGKVDGVILAPFRKLELLGCVRLYEQVVMWQQVGELNSSLTTTLQNLSEDLRLAERLQKGCLPRRFPEVKNFQVMSRYLAGTASGGDYFDLAEAKDKKSISIILSNSSSYGLSSAVLGILMKVTLKLSQEAGGNVLPSQVLKRVYDELLLVLGEKDQLSIFYGTITRNDLRLRYVHLGKSSAYFAPPGQGFKELPKQGGPICKGALTLDVMENEIDLIPEGRLAIISGGFDEVCGGNANVKDVLQRFRHKESVDTLNELVFKAKANIPPEKGMPDRDCSAVLFDVESRTLRSIPQEPDES
jgi:hypothetical protein